jgi:hypothetical protein
VAIWSTVETGIGISASAAATLRPLFKTFFGSSRVAGTSSSNNWPRSGYVRSNGLREEGYGLRSDLGKGTGVTTVIEGDADERGITSKGTFGDGGWNDSNSKLRGVSDDESEWRSGIMKTTGVTQGGI